MVFPAETITTPALTRAEGFAQRFAPASELPAMDPSTKELLTEALNAATLGGASFADARIGRYRNNYVFTREQQIVDVVDTDTMGVGVRVLVNGRVLARGELAAVGDELVVVITDTSRLPLV